MNFFKSIFKTNKKDILWNGMNRKHHYLFAHKLLKEAFFKNPSNFTLKAFKSFGTDPMEYLIEVWQLDGKMFCNPNEIIHPNGLNIEFINLLNNCDVCLITLPEPKYMTEAYFIALTLIFDHEKLDVLVDYIYFTLEFTVGHKPVICCWDKEGNHNFYGINIDPDKYQFLELIKKLQINQFLKLKNESIDDCNKAIEVDPNNPNHYLDRGVFKSKLGDKSGAISDYNKAIEINPLLFLAYNYRGLIKSEIGDNNGALLDFNRLIALNPKNDFAFFSRANINFALGKFKESISDYNKSIEINPKFALAFYNRGKTKLALGKINGAHLDWIKAGQLGYTNAYELIKQYCN